MKNSTNSENVTFHETKEIERQLALKVLEKAKKIKRKVIFLPQGASGSRNIINSF